MRFKKQVLFLYSILVMLAMLYSAIAYAEFRPISSFPGDEKQGWEITNHGNTSITYVLRVPAASGSSFEVTADGETRVLTSGTSYSYILSTKASLRVTVTGPTLPEPMLEVEVGEEDSQGAEANATATSVIEDKREIKGEEQQANTSGDGLLPATVKNQPPVVPLKGNGMYSKLVFEVNGTKIEFSANELIQIAQEVMQAAAAENVLIPQKGMYDSLLGNVLKKISSDQEVIQGEMDKYILIPLHIRGLDNIKKWLFVARYLSENHEDDFLRGWWVEVANRLLLIKNQYHMYTIDLIDGDEKTIEQEKIKWKKENDLREKFFLYKKGEKWFIFAIDVNGHLVDIDATSITNELEKKFGKKISSDNFLEIFPKDIRSFESCLLEEILSASYLGYHQLFYVSDHGFIADIVSAITEVAFALPWTDPRYVLAVKEMASLLASADEVKIKDGVGNSIAEASMSELKEFHPEFSEDELKKIQDDWRSDPAYQLRNWKDISETNQYMIQVLVRKYLQLKFVTTPGFDSKIYRDFAHMDADALIRRLVLVGIARDLNQGSHEQLFRPVYSYGGRNKGDSYQRFEQFIKVYLDKTEHLRLTDGELAAKMRGILEGKSIASDDLAFLPCLTAAWFISEAARNPLTTMTSLMLLDMLESNIQLDSGYGNWYSLSNALIHPLESIGGDVKDVYGDTKTHAGDFGGCHPMAHTGSYFQAQCTLLEGYGRVLRLAENEAVNQKTIEEGTIVMQEEGDSLIAYYRGGKKSLKTKHVQGILGKLPKQPPDEKDLIKNIVLIYGLPLRKPNAVRQKEGHLIIHWLQLMIDGRKDKIKDKYKIQIQSVKAVSNNGDDGLEELKKEKKQKEGELVEKRKQNKENKLPAKDFASIKIKKEIGALGEEIKRLDGKIKEGDPSKSKSDLVNVEIKKDIQAKIIEPFLRGRVSNLRNLLSNYIAGASIRVAIDDINSSIYKVESLKTKLLILAPNYKDKIVAVHQFVNAAAAIVRENIENNNLNEVLEVINQVKSVANNLKSRLSEEVCK